MLERAANFLNSDAGQLCAGAVALAALMMGIR